MTEPPGALLEIAERVDRRLSGVFDAQRKEWAAIDPCLVEAVDELERLTAGGKRLRAGFCALGWVGHAGGGVDEPDEPGSVIDACAAFELLQAFALIHDDIMDDADTRRTEQTIHIRQAERVRREGWRGEPRRYGDGVAILVGDLSHVYADQLIATDNPQTKDLWDRLRIELNLGQYLDMRSAAVGTPDRATAQRVATFKSALYTIVRPLQLGASLAGVVSDELLAELDAFGRPAGQAFQLRDDLLDVVGSARQVGKPVGNDIREGKPTELLAVAYDWATPAQRAVLANAGATDLSDADIEEIVGVMQATGAIEEVERRIEQLVEDATTVAHHLPFTEATQETLIAFAHYVASRRL